MVMIILVELVHNSLASIRCPLLYEPMYALIHESYVWILCMSLCMNLCMNPNNDENYDNYHMGKNDDNYKTCNNNIMIITIRLIITLTKTV